MKADLAKLRALHEVAFQWPPKNLDAFADAMHEALPDLIAEITRLRAIAEAVERDAKRLDALDAMGSSYGFEDMHEGNRWQIEGPYPNVRTAIDAAIDRLLTIGTAEGVSNG